MNPYTTFIVLRWFHIQQPTSGVTVRSLDLQIVVISSIQTVSSTVFQTRVSLQLISWLIAQRYRTDTRTPRDLCNASCSQVMCTRILALLPSIHVPCVHATSQVVGWAICAIVVLVGFIRSVLVFQTQRSTVEFRTGNTSLAVPHPLHQYRNRFHNHLQLKLPMGIPSPFCNSMQMASATNRLN